MVLAVFASGLAGLFFAVCKAAEIKNAPATTLLISAPNVTKPWELMTLVKFSGIGLDLFIY